MRKWSTITKVVTNNGVFSSNEILLQLVSFMEITNRFICQLMGKESTSSKKYVA